MKKIVATVCALFLLCTGTYAAEPGGVISVDSLTVSPGQQVEVPIRLTGNPGIVGARLTVHYGEGLVLTGIESGTALSSLTMTKPGDYSANPIRILWDGTDADRTDGVMATLRFTAPAQPGEYDITLSYDSGDIIDNDLKPISLALTPGTITVKGNAAEPGGAIGVDSLTVSPGQQVEVPIRLTGNPGIVGARLTVHYGEGLVLTGIESGTALSSLTMTKPGDYSANPIRILWDGTDADRTDGVMATLRFIAPAQPGEYDITLSYDSGDIIDNDLKPISLALTPGTITVKEPASGGIGITLAHRTSTSAEVTLTNQGSESVTAWCVMAAYDAQGRMVSVRSVCKTLPSQEPCPVSLVFEGGTDVHTLKVFLLAPGTLIPIQPVWSVAPIG